MYKYIRSLVFYSINSICKIFLEIFIFNKKIRTILKGNLAKIYLKKYVKNSNKLKTTYPNKEKSKIIWQYWNTGTENAPKIVQQCIKSVEKYKGDYQHVVLTDKTLKNYIQLPEIFEELRKKNIIKLPLYSDIIRIFILCEYGGIWMDATILMTSKLQDYMTEEELFVLQDELKTNLNGFNMANWFIISNPHNTIMEHTKNAMILYWKENLFLNNYFIMPHIFALLTVCNSECKEIFSKIPYFSYHPAEVFAKELLNPYDPKRWEQIKSMSAIHKLSFKPKVLAKHREFITAGTFYEKLENGELL